MFWISPVISILLLLFVGVVGLLVTTLVYIRIYVAVQRHKNQIQSQQVQEGAESGKLASFASLIKSAVGVFYVYLVFCYFAFLYLFGCLCSQRPQSLFKEDFSFPLDSCLS